MTDDIRAALRDYSTPAAPPAGGTQRVLAALDRRRRRRTTVVSAAATLVLVLGTGAAIGAVRGDRDRAPAPSTSSPSGVDVPPDGFRYVGMGSVAIAVPEAWPRDEVDCAGVPERGTYAVDTVDGFVCPGPLRPFPAGTDAVEIETRALDHTSGWTPVEIDGVEALRSPTETGRTVVEGAVVTTASIAVPSAGVVFTVNSSADPAHVDDLLDGIVVLDEHVGVPGYGDLKHLLYPGPDGERMAETYLDRLRAAGFAVEVVPETHDSQLPGRVMAVDPRPGTIVEPGATVRVRVAQ